MRRPSSSCISRPLLARHRRLALAPALVALLLATAVTACGGGDEETATQPEPTRARAEGVSVVELTRVSGSIGHPIYWAGSRSGQTYELSQTQDGRVYIRYLPRGTKIGDPKPNYLTVGTYPQAKAFATLKATAKKQGAPTIELRGGGLAFADKERPTSVYLAYPGSAYQIEVYHPSAARARALVTSGEIVPVGIATAGRAPSSSSRPVSSARRSPATSCWPAGTAPWRCSRSTAGRRWGSSSAPSTAASTWWSPRPAARSTT